MVSTALLVLMIMATWPSFSQGVDAQAGGRFDLQGPSQVEVGEPIVFTLTGRGVAALGGYEAAVLFDKSVATFHSVEQHNKDLTRVHGRDVEPLVAIEVPYGAAVGLVSCPVRDCVQRSGPRQNQGGQGNVELAALTLSASREGILEVKFDAIKIVNASGKSLPVSIPAKTFSIQVGPSDAGTRFPAPASPWSLPTATKGVPRTTDVTGTGLVTYSDLMEIALDWQTLREQGNPCNLPDPARDVNRDGCIDIADMQMVASQYSATGATPSVQGSALQAESDDASTLQQAGGNTYVVNSTDDDVDATRGNGTCDTAAGVCTLRAAIQEANNDSGPSLIEFNIPGPGVHTINLTKELPTLLDEQGGTTIDGYTQPGSSPNTDPLVSNANIMVEIRGGGETQYRGIAITSSNNLIQGLAWFRFERAIWVNGRNADANVFIGNFIGTNAAGTYGASGVASTPAHGMQIQQGASNNRIGGTSPSERNIISGNGRTGVSMWHGGTTGNILYNNLLGLRPDGTRCLPNRIQGADMNHGASNNIIGGTDPGQRNVATGNGFAGIDVSHETSTTGNQIIGNYIGTNVTGDGDVPNCANNQWGLRIKDGARNNVFRDNVIGNSRVAGIDLQSTPQSGNTFTTTNNTITRNRVGIGVNGNAIPNPVGIQVNGVNNVIGPDNIVTNNNGDGIELELIESQTNTITRNSIYNNGLGIDLSPNGVTPNDPGDGDNGPNQLLNFPVLSNATTADVSGTACAGCTVEVFIADSDANGNGEGRTFVGSGTASGNGSFVVTLTGVSGGDILTSTASDSSGNTSEFSDNIAVGGTATIPSAPSNLVATAVTGTQIELNWDDNADDEDNFVVERSTNENNWTELDTIAANSETFSDTTVTAGTTYFYRVRATNAAGSSAPSNTASATPDNPTGISLPGRIEAEDYREGGEGVGYHDTTSGNQGGAYRNDNVDIQTTQDSSGTYNVGWIDAGEWLAYDVTVDASGDYVFTIRMATPNNGRRLHIEIDDVNISGSISLPRTGSYQNWQSVTVGPFNIAQGNHTLKVVMETNGFNVNYVNVVEDAADPWDETIALPGRIEVENYRDGGQGVGYQDTTSGNQGGAYRQDRVDIQPTQDTGGGFNVGWTDAGEWLSYEVSVATSDNYVFTMRVASPQSGKRFHIELNDVDVTGTVSVPTTGGWQTWTDVSTPEIAVDAGSYTLKIVAETNGYNMNYLDVAVAP